MSILLEFWQYGLAAITALAALFYREKAKNAKQRADRAEWISKTYKEMRDHEREAMQLDDVSLADRISRKP